MIELSHYVERYERFFPDSSRQLPWHLTAKIAMLVEERVRNLRSEYIIRGDIAIHKDAVVEDHAVIKGPAIISPQCFIAAHAYLRGGVFLDEKVSVGPGCEIKSSVIFSNSALAHFNFVGDSIVGSFVNMEAGAVIANHYNERKTKTIFSLINGKPTDTGVQKFGALIGDYSKIGANAVLSPGTILPAESIVKRLTLIEQC